VALAVLAALTALLALPGTSLAKPKPGVGGRGFRLQARAIGAITINRVYCGLAATGEVCVDSTNSSTIGGGYWPKGSPQQYVFNSGLQAAGAIQDTLGWAWAGDTTGAFFFDPKGTTQHGQLVQPIWNSSSPADVAAWPQAAYVPQGDASADVFATDLQGRVSASQGDVWTVAWDGDPSLIAGRPHPLGIAVETRGLGWNYPTGNNDIVYFIYTFYNISSSCAADYTAIRPGMQEMMLGLGQQFQALNNAAFGITIPACGYTIKNFYGNFSADMDVSSDAGNNYSSVNLPFSLGYVYEDSFRRTEGTYRLPPDAGGAPFTGGYGFVGVKYLKSPINPLTGLEAGISLFSNTVNGGQFGDPANTQQLYRYVSGNITPSLGDGLCNQGVPSVTRICYIKSDGHADMRFFQSSGPFDLAPGQFGSIVVGYVFASAVSVGGCLTPGCPSVLPGNPLRMTDAANLQSLGANLVDSLTGFRGYTDGSNGNPLDNIVQQGEITTVKGSLLNKSLVAQSVFDSKFLLPSAPEAPDFFVVPGNNSVAIFWRPSNTEATGDVFYSAAASPTSLLYDPNYRQFDVEGYRIYRGRVDDPSALKLLAQYDYAGTTMRDYLGAVNPVPTCAPELGLFTNAGGACPVNFGPVPPSGTAYTVFTTYDVVSPFVQVKIGNRVLLANGSALVLTADTTVTGTESGANPEMSNTGVPFVYVDGTAKNNLRYFYAVTAFDVNSIQSGPTSLESARITKSATPVSPGSNYDNAGVLSIGIFGRGVNMSDAIPKAPGINSSTGVFTGPARPATGAEIGFVGDFVAQVVTQSGEMSLTLDSMAPGSAYDGAAGTFWYHVTSAAGTTPIVVSVTQDAFNASATASQSIDGGPIDAERAARYGGSTAYHLAGQWDLEFAGNYYTAAYGRGCVNAAPGFTSARCSYNGARWFDGAAESFAHPTQGNNLNFSNADVTNATTAGSLTGTAHVYEARSYQTRPNTYRNVEGVLGTVATAADYRLFWGAGGTVDSVVDVTHNVPLPFKNDMTRGYTWGFLSLPAQSAVGSGDARPATISVTDFGCVRPIKTFAASNGHLGCAAGTTFNLVSSLPATADFGPLRYGRNRAQDSTVTPTANLGFGVYLAGHVFLIEMNSATPTAPAAGTVWTMRSYVGAIAGGGGSVGTGGNQGAYSFTAVASPFTAVGASLKAAYSVTNAVRPATDNNLDLVHTVPDPYYVTNAFESSPSGKSIKFVNLPTQAIIRIYSTSGVLVRVIEHNSSQFGGMENWDVRNRNNQIVASGVYFYAIEAPSGSRRVGRMTIVNFAQ
jgi:hypothetical protein